MRYTKVSILIPAYNAEPWIADTIASARAQTWPNCEIVVVDDGSTDKTYQVAASYQSDNVIVTTQSNGGAGKARNHAFQLCSGEFIQYLDADDILAADKIALQMEILRNAAQDVLSSSSWAFFEESAETAQFVPSILWKDYTAPCVWLLDSWQSDTWMPIHSWLTPRQLISAVGGWNETLSLNDDGEFFCRVLLRSSAIKFCGDSRAYYRKGLSNSVTSLRNERAVRSQFRVCQLNESHMLSFQNTPETRRACAGNFQTFVYTNYPRHKALVARAEEEVRRLGGANKKRGGSPKFQRLNQFVGWKLSKIIQDFTYRHRLAPAMVKKKIFDLLRIRRGKLKI